MGATTHAAGADGGGHVCAAARLTGRVRTVYRVLVMWRPPLAAAPAWSAAKAERVRAALPCREARVARIVPADALGCDGYGWLLEIPLARRQDALDVVATPELSSLMAELRSLRCDTVAMVTEPPAAP